MWIALLAAAYADTLELDNGAVLVGELAAYDRNGECRIEIEEGDLVGAAVLVPCSRVARFERDAPPAAPEPTLAIPVEHVDPPMAVAPDVEPAPAALPEVPAPEEAPAAEISTADVPEVADVPEPEAVPAAAPAPAEEPERRQWHVDLPRFSDPFR